LRIQQGELLFSSLPGREEWREGIYSIICSEERERERERGEKGGSVTAQLRCIEFRLILDAREKKNGKIK